MKALIAPVVGGRWTHGIVYERDHANIVNLSASISNLTVAHLWHATGNEITDTTLRLRFFTRVLFVV